jgi:hypothetical protein
MTINGNGQGGNAIIVASGLSGFVFDQMTAENAAVNGILMNAYSATVVKNSTFTGNGHDQFVVAGAASGTSDGLQITGSVFDDSNSVGGAPFVALAVYNTNNGALIKNIVISDNIVRYTGTGANETDGIALYTESSSVYVQNVVVSNNTIQMSGASTAGNGIEVWSGANLTVCGNVTLITPGSESV